jgi:deoxyribodipyrimidine photolyase-related protein
MSTCIRFVLGDQLNLQHPWFTKPEPSALVVLMEMRQETDYVVHHIQKVVAFFGAMRAFAEELSNSGHRVEYLRINDPRNRQNLVENLKWLAAEHGATRLELQEPDEYRLDVLYKSLEKTLGIAVSITGTHHFITSRYSLSERFPKAKQFRQEVLYRQLRVETGVLMDGKEPVGGNWNYDADNRKAFDARLPIPEPLVWKATPGLEDLIAQAGVKTMGEWGKGLRYWPITRSESLDLLNDFIEHRLPFFGPYQDAMGHGQPFLYHSRLSFSLNTHQLHPLEVVQRVEQAWRAEPERIPLASAEGFIRQVLGWREYVRGIYWHTMPNYATGNALGHRAKLPAWYWTGNTRMACMRAAIGQSLQYAYAHHIQRLMITGNFALLLGVDPSEVDAWYLGIYADAIEWVEMPNTRGMSQWADGGLMASKPYISSGQYIKKMGNHCAACAYSVAERTGPKACPFNALYWDFVDRHRNLLQRNPRMAMACRSFDQFSPQTRAALLEKAAEVKSGVDGL